MMQKMIDIIILIAILYMLSIINTILGIMINTKNNKFNWKKFWKGILKVFLFCICIIAYYLSLELFYIIVLRAKIIISEDIITFAEIIGIFVTAYKKYAYDCYKKIKTILKVDEKFK